MTLSSAIEDVWDTHIWQHATIQAITDKIFTSDNSQVSEFEIGSYYSDQELNAIVYQVKRSESYIGANVLQERFAVEITYYRTKEGDTSGENWTAVRDFFETLTGLVTISLGTNWQGTVAYYRAQETPPDITDQVLAGELTWVGKFVFTGFI